MRATSLGHELATRRLFNSVVRAKAPPRPRRRRVRSAPPFVSSDLGLLTMSRQGSGYSGGHSRRRALLHPQLHCWSRGAGGPSASFHAGSCNARALASAESGRQASRATMRCTLFSGCLFGEAGELTCHAVAKTSQVRPRRRTGSTDFVHIAVNVRILASLR